MSTLTVWAAVPHAQDCLEEGPSEGVKALGARQRQRPSWFQGTQVSACLQVSGLQPKGWEPLPVGLMTRLRGLQPSLCPAGDLWAGGT